MTRMNCNREQYPPFGSHTWRAGADSNCALRLRRPTLCPLSYGGVRRNFITHIFSFTLSASTSLNHHFGFVLSGGLSDCPWHRPPGQVCESRSRHLHLAQVQVRTLHSARRISK